MAAQTSERPRRGSARARAGRGRAARMAPRWTRSCSGSPSASAWAAEAAAGAAAPQRDLLRGAVTNALSPHPWLFWITVGAPILAQGDAADAVLFLGAFYLLLIGSKVLIAVTLGAGRERLMKGRGYAVLLRASGLLLLATGVILAIEGVRALA